MSSYMTCMHGRQVSVFFDSYVHVHSFVFVICCALFYVFYYLCFFLHVYHVQFKYNITLEVDLISPRMSRFVLVDVFICDGNMHSKACILGKQFT